MNHPRWWLHGALALAVTAGTAATLLAAPVRGQALPAGVAYAYPPPGARYVRAGTPLLVRFARVPGTATDVGRVLAVVGASGGPCPGRAEWLAPGSLLRFTPDRPFPPGEHVTVTVGGAAGAYAFDVAASSPALPASVLVEDEGAGAPARAPWSALPRAQTDTLPLEFPLIDASVQGPTAPGRILLASFEPGAPDHNFLLIVGDDGRPVFQRRMPGMCTDFKRQPDGRLSYYDGAAGKFFLLDSTFAVVDSVQSADGYATDLHELRLLPDGHALLLSYDPQVVDMSQVVPGGYPQAVVTGLVLQELDASGGLVFGWRSWDHFQITDATHEDLTAATIDYVHGNAIELDADGNLVLSSRHMDEITKIDRVTGEILWRWGGAHNQFAFEDDSLGFSHQHAIRRLENGHFTLFDNGNFHVPPFSRAVEYTLDEGARTARLVWQYRATPDIYGSAMGYVQRLPNGNTLVGWGLGKPDVTELEPDGAVALTMSLPAGVHSYRAYRQSWAAGDSAAAPAASGPQLLSPDWPNPFRAQTELLVSLPATTTVTLEVYDLSGRRLQTVFDHARQGAGVYRAHVDLAGRPSGIYFCRLTAGRATWTRAIVLAR